VWEVPVKCYSCSVSDDRPEDMFWTERSLVDDQVDLHPGHFRTVSLFGIVVPYALHSLLSQIRHAEL
jgi:hypothetical protein